MSQSVDLSTYGKDLKKVYDDIVAGDPSVSWAVFNYEGNVLKPSAQGGKCDILCIVGF